jgi:hypothetical protein
VSGHHPSFSEKDGSSQWADKKKKKKKQTIIGGL